MNLAEGFSGQGGDPRLLLVASNGGHLEQLWRLSRSATIHPESLWVTFDSPQAQGMLTQERHRYIPEIGQRDWVGAVRAIGTFQRILSTGDFDGIVSTGAAIAASAFAAGRATRTPGRYIESVSRVRGPSVTGRLIWATGLAGSLWTQYESWSDRRWEYRGAVMDSFESYERSQRPAPKTAFVTLGTLKRYPFDRAVRSLQRAAADLNVTWQLGVTNPPDGLAGSINAFTSSTEFDTHAREADVVVSHAGVGSVLRLLEMGVFPVLVIRRKSHGEHIDDHQAQIAEVMAERGLAIVREADAIEPADLVYAAGRGVRPVR